MAVRLAIVLAGALAVLAACDSGGPGVLPEPTARPNIGSTVVPVTPAEKPQTVPQEAQAVEQSATLGRIIRRANEGPQAVRTRSIEGATCQDDLMVIDTSVETIYAALPCDRFWDADARDVFLNAQVAIVLEVTETRFRVLIETLTGARAEFTVAGIWVE